MCQNESWGAIFAPKETHSTQRGQPPRMHGPGLWRYEQKEQRVTPVPMSGVNCDLWCPRCEIQTVRSEFRMTNQCISVYNRFGWQSCPHACSTESVICEQQCQSYP